MCKIQANILKLLMVIYGEDFPVFLSIVFLSIVSIAFIMIIIN